MRTKVAILILGIFLCSGGLAQANTWPTIPISAYGMDIDGDNVVAGNQRYNVATQTLTTFNMPDGSYANIYGIDGDNIAGYFEGSSGVRGFLYDGADWTTIHKTGADRTIINDIEGNNLVGTYYDLSGIHGFLYDLSNDSWTILNKLGASTTTVTGISGSNIVGEYYDGIGSHGFLYDISAQTWTTLPILAFAIDGTNIVGGGNQLYNIDTQILTNLDAPGIIFGIDGDNIVGQGYNGFVGVIPEPASILIFGLSALFLSCRHKT
jgi:hypothetical protein